jgi:hypothetical protein
VKGPGSGVELLLRDGAANDVSAISFFQLNNVDNWSVAPVVQTATRADALERARRQKRLK